MPNLYMNRGRLLVSQEKYEQAIPEFQTALAFARTSTYFVIREETSTHALRAIAVAYWNMRQYRPAYDWMF
jgi:tetratricopeptide (TPR) repeat protein